ncbi:MAG: DedA family protein [Solirubrobacteraceae bacterium]
MHEASSPPGGTAVLIPGLHLFHHIHGAAVDYVGVGVAAFVSWAGLPGPGESVLIATGVLSARHHLDITPVILWATVGAVLGGIAGWLVGLKAGRAALTASGPLRGARLRAAARGDEVFQRLEVIAILLTPSWVAGIYRAPSRHYLPINAVAALAWALGFGLGAYYVGPPILDLAGDVGTVATLGLLALIALAVGLEVSRRVRRRRATDDPAERRPDEAAPAARRPEL